MAQGTLAEHPSGRPGSDQSIQIALLGPLVISRNGQSIDVTGPKRRALLTFLALHLDTPVGRDEIIEAIWPRRQTGREESTLRVHISHLRDKLEPDRSDEPKILLTRGQAYLLSGHTVQLDTRRFDDLVTEARSHLETRPDVALEHLDEALALWRGRPLQDVEYEEFAQESIRSLERTRVDAIEDRAEALIAVGEDIAAVQDLEPLVRSNANRERPTSLLMLALYRLGRQADALRTASRHARHLSQQGLEPSPRIGVLEERILNHDPTLLPEEVIALENIRPGRSIRGYELRGEAGRGSIGVVYRAYQPSVGREVAMKVIHPAVAGTPDFVRRFAEEARVIASLEHPHIVPLHDFWREPSGAFLVMRWMDGGSLADRLGKSWEPETLARTFDQIGSALGHAHSRGVVHRDVKPANVLFDASGNAYLCDFGLAVAGIETGVAGAGLTRTVEPPYASPELTRGEGPTVASDVFGLGVLLAEAASGRGFPEAMAGLSDSLWEVVSIATAANPADRFPDMAAFRLSLAGALGGLPSPAPRTVRRNPYKGLKPFDEVDAADFYGRDDVVDSLLGAVASHGLVAVVGASGSGKSSVVKAGLVPALRDGTIRGSEEWFIVTMVPGTDPFDEFHIGLRDAAVGSTKASTREGSRELREAFATALDGPNSRALLIIDQFEELFSVEISNETRERFFENVVDLVMDPSQRVRVVVTMRADFSDRPLAHPGFGELFARSSYLLAPMRPEQVEEVIRGPAGRVGVQVEPGLISEIVRDISDAPAYLPLLQYILSELFERRTEDRLTVQTYRSLGGVDGVLERRAEATFSTLSEGAKGACRQLFLRMVHLGDHGEQTRRRLPLTEVAGLGDRGEVEEALGAFATARLLTYDRDPVSRTPTVEVAHETVIERWTRYRVWIDETRSDILSHRRLSSAAETWVESGEDPVYLLTGGPLTAALDLARSETVLLNAVEYRYVEESRRSDEETRSAEAERRQREAALEQRSRRRLAIGIGSGVIAIVIAVLAVFAFIQRQRADDLAEAQERQSLARELAAASIANLDSSDPDLSLLLGIEAAELSLNSEEEVLPEVVDALHRALINPRPELIIEGAGNSLGGQMIDYSSDGASLAALAADRGVFVINPNTGDELGRVSTVEPRAVGVAFHPRGDTVLTTHPDGVREWDWRSGLERRRLTLPDGVSVTTAIYSNDGSKIAVGGDDGAVRVYATVSSRLIAELRGHEGAVAAIDFDPSGARLVSGGGVGDALEILVWDIATEQVAVRASPETTITIITSINHIAWHPFAPFAVVATSQGEIIQFNTDTGNRHVSFGNGNSHSQSVAYDPTGSFVVAAGTDGFAHMFGAWVGGEAVTELPTGGLPLRDAAFNPVAGRGIATVGVDGNIRIFQLDNLGSELSVRARTDLSRGIAATPDGSRYVSSSNVLWPSAKLLGGQAPMMEVVDSESGEVLLEREAVQALGRRRPAITDDGSLVAYPAPSGNIALVNVDNGAVTELPDSATWNIHLDFSDNGTLLAGTGLDGSIAVWDVATSQPIITLTGHGDRTPPYESDPRTRSRVDEVMFRPGTHELYSAGYDGTIRAWNIETGEGRILRTFDYEIISLAFTADGPRLASADRSGSVVMMDANSGEIELVLEAVSGPAELTFSTDGSLLAGAGPGTVVHLWNTQTGLLQRRLQGAIYPVMGTVFVNDGTELRVSSDEGLIRGYLLDPVDLVELARQEVSRGLTEDECQRYLSRSCDG
ncbi:MAG TPA: BTAD domain-containing putative transcriptional regulator [Acidimicrobiia bacterium]|nr:BTAD domain-containing putative transcriptional regulator [Acidimicrobiia bacterium]